MKGIHVDPVARTARAEGGVLWKEFNRETQLHGLATTGGVIGTTGIAGLTLGGGLGWLMTKCGLALDNLRSAELVMADGRVTRASQSENPDLFWAIRGGGGNFGIATSPSIPARRRSNDYGRTRRTPVRKGFRRAAILQGAMRDGFRRHGAVCRFADSARRLRAKLVGILAAHFGSLAEGEAAVKPLKAFGPPVMDALGPLRTARSTGCSIRLSRGGP